jgi:predicted aminopeptidase
MAGDRSVTQGITPAVEMIHQLPGRVRFRVPALRMDQWVACYLEQRLAACAGIRQVGAGVAEGRIDFVIFF